jgi:hypothetical protein
MRPTDDYDRMLLTLFMVGAGIVAMFIVAGGQ